MPDSPHSSRQNNRSRAGVVLAGGFSTRFGETDKALAEINGTPMLARVVDRLAAVVDAVVVSCRAAQHHAFDRVLSDHGGETPVTFAFDPEPDNGPLAGIAHSFQRIEATYAAVVACDMPFVEPGFIEVLFEQAAGHDAVVPELDDGHRQPTQAVYHVEHTSRVAERRLAADQLSLHGALGELDTVLLPPDAVAAQTTRRSLADLNSRAEFTRAVSAEGDDPDSW